MLVRDSRTDGVSFMFRPGKQCDIEIILAMLVMLMMLTMLVMLVLDRCVVGKQHQMRRSG